MAHTRPLKDNRKPIIHSLLRQITDLTTENKQLKADASKSKTQAAELDKYTRKLQVRVDQQATRLSRLEAEAGENRLAITTLEHKNDTQRALIVDLRHKNTLLTRALEAKAQEIKEIETAREREKEEFNVTISGLSLKKASIFDDLIAEEREHREDIEERVRLKREIESLTEQYKIIAFEQDSLNREKDRLEGSVSELKKQLSASDTSCLMLRDMFQRVQAEKKDLEEKFQREQKEKADALQAKANAERRLDNQRESTRAMKHYYEAAKSTARRTAAELKKERAFHSLLRRESTTNELFHLMDSRPTTKTLGVSKGTRASEGTGAAFLEIKVDGENLTVSPVASPSPEDAAETIPITAASATTASETSLDTAPKAISASPPVGLLTEAAIIDALAEVAIDEETNEESTTSTHSVSTTAAVAASPQASEANADGLVYSAVRYFSSFFGSSTTSAPVVPTTQTVSSSAISAPLSLRSSS